MVMTYNYRWKGSTITGAIAPLDHAARNVKIHIDRILQWAPASSVLLGIGYYGYNWPVKSKAPNASVQKDKKTFGGGLERHVRECPGLAHGPSRPSSAQYDGLEGSAYYTYWSTKWKTYRQVYFEDERSVAAKEDYAIAKGLGGIGIWTLDNDKGYDEHVERHPRQVLRPGPPDQRSSGKVLKVSRSTGVVSASIRIYARETGTVPERGTWRWTLRDAAGKLVRSGDVKKQTIYPGRLVHHTIKVKLGAASRLPAGTYTLRVRFITSRATWRSPVVAFHQKY